jgi:hypothetical protein
VFGNLHFAALAADGDVLRTLPPCHQTGKRSAAERGYAAAATAEIDSRSPHRVLFGALPGCAGMVAEPEGV